MRRATAGHGGPPERLCGSPEEDVGRAGFIDRVVRRVAVDALCTAVLAARADDHRPAALTECDRIAELVKGLVVRGLHVRLLRPRGAGPCTAPTSISESSSCLPLRIRPASDVTRDPWNATFRNPLNVN